MIVQFLRAWYGPRLLDELVRLPAEAELAATYAGEAFRLLAAGGIRSEDLLRGSPAEIIARAERGLVETPKRASLVIAKVPGLIGAERYAEADDCLTELCADLWARDCQSCGRPFQGEMPALCVTDLSGYAGDAGP